MYAELKMEVKKQQPTTPQKKQQQTKTKKTTTKNNNSNNKQTNPKQTNLVAELHSHLLIRIHIDLDLLRIIIKG